MEQTFTEKHDQGFTLIELLIAIVVVGILTAVAIVGISSLTNSGRNAACSTTGDAVRAAEAVHYANSNGAAATSLGQMAAAGELVVSGGATLAAPVATSNVINGSGWTLTYTPRAGAVPSSLSACPA